MPDVTLRMGTRQTTPPPSTPDEWILSDDTGISSKVIWAVMKGVDPHAIRRPDVPHDPPDFGRCYRLLQLFPQWRGRIGEVAEELPRWRGLVEHWDELEVMYEECCDERGNYAYRGNEDAASALYNRMKELRP